MKAIDVHSSRKHLPSGSNVKEIHEVANDTKVIHVGECVPSLLAHLFDISIVVLLKSRLGRQCLCEKEVAFSFEAIKKERTTF
jgi:hypothetical protein